MQRQNKPMTKKHSLIATAYANEANLLELVRAQLAAGADPSEKTEYFETPLRVSSNNGRFDVVKCLFEAGADPSHLNWTPLFHAIAYATLAEVKNCLSEGSSLETRDTWKRTPVLLAVQTGDIEKVSCLIAAGADTSDLGQAQKTALEYAIQMDNSSMLNYLIGLGLGIGFDNYNQYGYTPLMQAAEDGALNCVRCLLQQGVDVYKKDRSQFSQKTPIAHASTLEIAQILVAAGDDLNQLHSELRAQLLGLDQQEKLTVTKQDYLEQKHRQYGNSNPQKCDIPFWYDMVRCQGDAWKARNHYGDTDISVAEPVWSYERYGKSITAVGEGEYIEIAGEHEDSYDPDFCIYNEVFHHRGSGEFTIYQYPKEVFPPTDFHTETLCDPYIYIIGNLGYFDERDYGSTPVYRLHTESFRMEKLVTSGDLPGWIHNHSAAIFGESVIRIQGGEIVEKVDGKEHFRINSFDFELDLISLIWTRHEHMPKSGTKAFFPAEYKQFSHNDGSQIAIESGGKWRLLKIIEVYRIDVSEGQTVQIENETFTATTDDFLFVVAFSTSELFETFEQLETSIETKNRIIEIPCTVCKTTSFPSHGRFMGFEERTQQELKQFNAWKKSIER